MRDRRNTSVQSGSVGQYQLLGARNLLMAPEESGSEVAATLGTRQTTKFEVPGSHSSELRPSGQLLRCISLRCLLRRGLCLTCGLYFSSWLCCFDSRFGGRSCRLLHRVIDRLAFE